MIRRKLTPLIRQRLAKFPAAAILGPRQCGKTTLAKQLGGRYFDLEQQGAQVLLDAQWDEVIAGRELIVLDEVQQAPDIFPTDTQHARGGWQACRATIFPNFRRL